jgi:DNA repair protein RadC
MNPLSLEGTTMVPTSPLRIILRTLRRRPVRVSHPDAVGDAPLNLPRRVDGPAAAAQLAAELLLHHREDITLAVYLDGKHRLCGTAILAVGWVQAVRLSARPILQGSQACRAEAAVLVPYGRSRPLRATDSEQRSFGAMAAECARHGLVVVDHLVVVGSGEFSSWNQGYRP